jgi:HupE / UreJ protein
MQDFGRQLCLLRYQIQDFRKVVVLVTAFTIGHSATLALSALHLVHVNTRLIEFLIPLTIVATACNNLFQRAGQVEHPSRLPLIYFFALFFGLIHGLAFASTFLSLQPWHRSRPTAGGSNHSVNFVYFRTADPIETNLVGLGHLNPGAYRLGENGCGSLARL